MNKLLFASLFFLFLFYISSLNVSSGVAFILFMLSVVFLGGAMFMELGKDRKKVPYLRLVK